jgi:predicted AlkP superfamily pyrophosphatase or phosphodiesterase
MKKIIYINLDGFSYSYYQAAKELGKTKIFDSFSEKGFIFSNLRSGITSITNPMQGAILSGAWSNKTHNFYHHYDNQTKTIVKHLRTNDAENVASAYLRNNLSAISIHQFMLENQPCLYDVKDRAYFKTETMPSNYQPRLEILKNIILRRPVKSLNEEFVYKKLPEFISVYIDDLDSLGHNNREYDGIPVRKNFNERLLDIIKRIEEIQVKLLEIIECTKKAGEFNDLVFLITTDHGMTKFFGESLLNRMLKSINELGIKVDLVSNRNNETELILLPYNIQCSVYFDKPLTEEKIQKLKKFFASLNNITFYDKEMLINTYDMDNRCPEFLLFANYPGHFYHRDFRDIYGASHDSRDETSQHIFGLLFGAGVAKKKVYSQEVFSIDLIPTISKKVHGIKLKDATGKIHDDFFIR